MTLVRISLSWFLVYSLVADIGIPGNWGYISPHFRVQFVNFLRWMQSMSVWPFVRCVTHPWNRGRKTLRGFNTTNLIQHLKKHAKEYKEFVMIAANEKKEEVEEEPKQRRKSRYQSQRVWSGPSHLIQTIRTNEHSLRKLLLCWSPRCCLINLQIVIGSTTWWPQPNHDMSCHRVTHSNMHLFRHDTVREKIDSNIANATYVAFTSDVWTSDNNLDAFLSSTGHWIDDDWHRHTAILKCLCFDGVHHTGEGGV